jgi:thiamine-phosphate pyrophosphorylase
MTAEPIGVVAVTDRTIAQAAGHRLVDAVAGALDGGADAVLLREKDLATNDRRRLADELRAATAACGAELWVAGDADLAVAVGADGVHLAAADPWPGADQGLRLGRSCHRVADLLAARDEGADQVTYSPVFATASKPGYGPPLGFGGLAAGCRAVPGVAVIALGGLEPGRARGCAAAGASGVALMGAVMGAHDPAAVVRSVIDELTGASP